MSTRQIQKAPHGAATEAEDDVAAAPTFYIRAVASMVGVSSSMIRDWENQELIAPQRAPNGYRIYDYDDIKRLRRIRDLIESEGLTTLGVKRLLGAPRPAGDTAEGIAARADLGSLGKRIHRLRLERGLTLRQLSAETGLAPSHISAIERSVKRASMASVRKIAEALGTTFLQLIGAERGGGEELLVRADERGRPSIELPGVSIEKLSRRARHLDAHMLTIEPGFGSDGAYQHEGEEFVFVVRGELELTLEETDTFVLRPGDALTFQSHRPHRWRNSADEDAVVLWVDTPPNF